MTARLRYINSSKASRFHMIRFWRIHTINLTASQTAVNNNSKVTKDILIILFAPYIFDISLLAFTKQTESPYILNSSNQNAVAVVDLVLDDLCGEAGVARRSPSESLILILYADRLVSRAGSGTSQKREAAFLRLIRPGLADDLRVIHHRIFTVVAERDDALRDADHIRRHADTGLTVRPQRVQQIPPEEDIFLDGGL